MVRSQRESLSQVPGEGMEIPGGQQPELLYMSLQPVTTRLDPATPPMGTAVAPAGPPRPLLPLSPLLHTAA